MTMHPHLPDSTVAARKPSGGARRLVTYRAFAAVRQDHWGQSSEPGPAQGRTNIPMAATLQEILLAPQTQPQVTADCFTLIEQELADKSGLSGTAVKLAYKTVNKFMPGHVRHMVGELLPDMVARLDTC